MKKIVYILIIIILSIISCTKIEDKERNLTLYTITAELDTLHLFLNCNMKVDWYNSSDTLVYEIPFIFQLDSAKTLINKVWIDNQNVDFKYVSKEESGFEGFILTLRNPIKSFHKTAITINFKTKKSEYYREKILFFSEDFPTLQYFDNGNFNPSYQVHSDYNVTISYPSKFNIASSGLIVARDTINNTLEINTSAKSIPSYGFVLFKDICFSETKSSGVLIRSFYFENDTKWGKKLLEYSKDIIKFYKDTLGFYPQPLLNIIPGAAKPYGGWPVCPNVVGIHRGIDLKKERAETHAHWIMAHEIGHQYWGFNYVLEPKKYPQWFGIGMGIYTDRMYSIKKNIDKNYTNYFSSSYLKGVSKGYNTTIMQTIDTLNKQKFNWNNIIEHDKSYSVLRMLAYEIGEETFYKVFTHCIENYKGVNVTLEIFKKDCEKISNTDLSEFFQTWFYTNDYLEYQIENVNVTKKNNQCENEIIINKIGKANISHIKVAIVLENDEIIYQQFNGRQLYNKIKVQTNKPIKEIILDPDLKLLLVNRKSWEKNN